MKVNKIVLGLLIVLTIALFPKTSVSQDAGDETIVLSKGNTLILNTEVDGDSISEVISNARALDGALSNYKETFGKKKPLYLFLNTPGGSIQAGLELIEALKGMGRTVNTITLFAASMGFQIAQNLDDRLILKNGVLMSHHATGQFTGAFGGSHPSQVDSRYQLWLDRIRELDEQTVKRTKGKQSYESYTKQYDHETWLTGDKSIKGGYADRIVLVKCDQSLKGVTTKHVNFFGMDIAYDLDNCPINTSPMNIRVVNPDGKALNNEMVAKIKDEFLTKFTNKQKQVLPMMF